MLGVYDKALIAFDLGCSYIYAVKISQVALEIVSRVDSECSFSTRNIRLLMLYCPVGRDLNNNYM
jgi:hypothetical protein